MDRKKADITITIAESICILFWLAFFRNTDAYYLPYLIAGVAGIVCRCRIVKYGQAGRAGAAEILLSAAFAIACSAANYRLFSGKHPAVAVCFAGAFCSMVSILMYLRTEGSCLLEKKLFREESPAGSPVKVFLLSAAAIAAVDCAVLFLAKYPGALTEDSISQIDQLMTGVYSNHHPVFHTLIIKALVKAGLAVSGGDFNFAVALYSVFQILLMACTFGYLCSTLSRMNVKKVFVVLAVLYFAALPCHFMYSFTMWKDIPFASAAAVFLITFFRMINGIGRRSPGTWILLALSSLGVCLLRSNGWAIFLFSAFIFAALFLKREKKMCAVFAAVIIVSFILKNPVLDAAGVSRTDTVESLSIPVQQIARVIKECKNQLTPDQRELLDRIIDVDHAPLYYSEFISNPIKNLIRDTGDQEYMKEHMGEYIRLYLQLGWEHPKQYFEAYVEQTKGLWNSGYDYWITVDMVADNSYGIAREVRSGLLNSEVDRFISRFSRYEFLSIFQSIGFHVWLTVVLLYTACTRKNRAAAFLAVPLLLNVGSLLVATPVFAEFRYTYSIFCVIPFLLFSVFYKNKKEV